VPLRDRPDAIRVARHDPLHGRERRKIRQVGPRGLDEPVEIRRHGHEDDEMAGETIDADRAELMSSCRDLGRPKSTRVAGDELRLIDVHRHRMTRHQLQIDGSALRI